jgi:Lon protease-like protein
MIPLFPLGLVLLPQAELPLHIFEQRYKVMINECLDQNQVFGIVCFDGKKMHKVGCTARIIRIIKQYRDGRMDIAVKGERRFYVEHIDENREFIQSRILFIDDVDEPAAPDNQDLVDKAINLLKRLDKLLGVTRDYAYLATLDIKQLSFLIPGSEGFTLEERQRFLELTSSHQRLVKGMQVLENIIARVKISRKVSKIIGGNGQVKALLAEKGILMQPDSDGDL